MNKNMEWTALRKDKKISNTDLVWQHSQMKNEMNTALYSIIEAGSFVGGDAVSKWEGEWANYIGARHCIGVGNGTDALEIAISSLDLPKNSEIVVPINTFFGTAEAVHNSGHKVVFAPVCDDEHNLNAETVSPVITKNTKAIIAVHLYGNPVEWDGIKRLAEDHVDAHRSVPAAAVAGLDNHRPLSFDVTCVSVKRTSAVKGIVLR